MKVYNFEQKSNEWFEIRKGKMTASHAQAIGNRKKGLETYIYELMAEYYSTGEKEYYTNKDMERGNELENQARIIYELERDVNVNEVGFIEYDEFVGCSPDGLIMNNGGIEIKCLNDVNFFKQLLNEEIESKYIWQIQMNLLITGREWWDYVSYNPNFKKSLFIKRILPDDKIHKELLGGIKIGKEKIKEIKLALTNNKN